MKPTWCTIFSVYFINFIYNLYMFQTSPGPSLGETTVFIWHLVLVNLYSWPSGMQDGIPIQNTSAKCHIKYSCSSWWWSWRGPKNVEVINKTDEIYWEYHTPSWFHLQDCLIHFIVFCIHEQQMGQIRCFLIALSFFFFQFHFHATCF